ncbi:hypothetical protein DP939_23405 [Spongiactinospora rosea]|uniref:Uncharacterized protein n=2 Tax=Spongiactinospora rosea TaxID=2248750 RepID=A0A366LWR7_9ACTN|nr:hypothetical protein DP939_23405 [Spongiactinospora rosea]
MRVFLQGGPDDLSQAARRCRAPADDPEVKVPRRNGYEHFCRTTEILIVDRCEFTVYRWSYRTCVAE